MISEVFKGELPGVDIAKFIFSFVVVGIHIHYLDENVVYPPFLEWIMSLGVPYFFIAMGYLLQRKLMTQTIETRLTFLKNRSVSLLKIFIIWLIIYLPLTIFHDFILQRSLEESLIDYIKNVVIRGESYLAWPLWFIYAAAVFHACYYLVLKFRIKKPLLYLGIFFISLGLVLFILERNPGTALQNYLCNLLNRPLGGGIFLTAGSILILLLPEINNKIILILSFLFAALSILLFVNDWPFHNLTGALGVFLLTLRLQNINGKNFFLILRNQSMWIYYLHMYFIFFLYLIIKRSDFLVNLWYCFLIVSFSVYIFVSFLTFLIRKYNLKWLMRLIK